MELKIDYSEVEVQQHVTQSEDWEPPVHKFFGKKLPNGKMEKEPVYVHQEYPRLMYSLKEGKIVAKLVRSDVEKEALGEGWEKNPGAFGYIGAPSFEQNIELREKAEAAKLAAQDEAKETTAAVMDVIAKKRGRPAKA